MAGKKINFRSGMDSLVRHQFPGLQVEHPATELIARLLNDVNSEMITFIEKDCKSKKIIDENAIQNFAQKAVTKVFSGDMCKNALSEAHKQLALLQSGCMVYGSDEKVTEQLKKMREAEASEALKRQKIEKEANLFKSGVKKAFAKLLPNLSLDYRAAELLGHRMHNFAKIVADEAAKVHEKKEELQPPDIKSVISKYVQSKALSAAHSEGNKCLVLFENGLLDFKPRRTIKSGWSQETVVKDQIFSSVFKSGVRRLLSDANPDANVDSKAPKFLGHILMDVAKYLAEASADHCKKKKIQELGNQELEAAVTVTFSEQLRQHAILHASEDVANYSDGLLLYERTPEKPVKRKARTHLKSSKASKRRKLISKGRSTSGKRKTPSKRPGSKSSSATQKSPISMSSGSKKPPSTTPRRPRIQAPPPKKSVLAPLVTEAVPAVFTDVDVVLSRDASNNTGGVLEDVCQALVLIAVTNASTSKGLGQKQVMDAVLKVLPKNLADHSIAFGSNLENVDILPMESTENGDDTT